MTWYAFDGVTPADKQAAFVAWHDTVCAAEQIPRPGRNQADQTIQVDETWTTAYADALQLTDGRLVVALADDDPHTAGLTPTVVDVGDPFTGGGDLAGAVVVSDAKSIPERWTE